MTSFYGKKPKHQPVNMRGSMRLSPRFWLAELAPCPTRSISTGGPVASFPTRFSAPLRERSIPAEYGGVPREIRKNWFSNGSAGISAYSDFQSKHRFSAWLIFATQFTWGGPAGVRFLSKPAFFCFTASTRT